MVQFYQSHSFHWPFIFFPYFSDFKSRQFISASKWECQRNELHKLHRLESWFADFYSWLEFSYTVGLLLVKSVLVKYCETSIVCFMHIIENMYLFIEHTMYNKMCYFYPWLHTHYCTVVICVPIQISSLPIVTC